MKYRKVGKKTNPASSASISCLGFVPFAILQGWAGVGWGGESSIGDVMNNELGPEMLIQKSSFVF